MAWNEPGGGSRDPWSGGGRGGGNAGGGPPDLDEVFRKLRDQIRQLFGGKVPEGPSRGPGSTAIILLIGAAFVVWMLSGIYIVDQGKRGVTLTFGAHAQTTEPGPHWHWPRPIGHVDRVNVEERKIIEVGYESMQGRSRPVPNEALMITRDENIVDVRLAIQYRIEEPFQYLFNFRMPDETLKQVTESALREIIGKRELDFVLTEGRTEVAQETGRLVQSIMEEYETGLTVVQSAVQDIQPPEEVQPAFEDAIRAREDEQRTINRAQAYANELIPRAGGQAARVLEEAEGHRDRVIAEAEGDAARFDAVRQEYAQAPDIMRQRLYLETMEEILGRVSKVMVDMDDGAQSLMYLPIDRMMERGGSAMAGDRQFQELNVPEQRDAVTPTRRASQALRERGTR